MAAMVPRKWQRSSDFWACPASGSSRLIGVQALSTAAGAASRWQTDLCPSPSPLRSLSRLACCRQTGASAAAHPRSAPPPCAPVRGGPGAPGDEPSPKAGQGAGRPVARRAQRIFRAPGRLRGRPGQWGYDCVLGRRHLLPDQRPSQHLSFGEFSSKFAAAAEAAPWLSSPDVLESPAGTHPLAEARKG